MYVLIIFIKIYVFNLGGIGLITNEEVNISDISQELSEEFMKLETIEDFAAEFSIDDDDLVSFFLLILL